VNLTGARISERLLAVEGASDEGLARDLEAKGLTLTVDEARKVALLLGRDPTVVEANIFNTMWSEHCSYKSSRKVLAEHLPTEGPDVVLGPGEDAGVVRLCEHEGTTYCVAIAHESHNHPSQVVPNEGAATGIGGIVRDVYCMGADVVGVLDPLRFGDPTGAHADRVAEIVHGVVEGIWQYGNALGVPNLGGDVYFDRSYDDNCLVNVVAIGLVRERHVIRSRVPEEARDGEYDVVLVGKPTDPSGFGGATFASRILDEEKAVSDKYAVQVPDPFLKRMLTVATAEVLSRVRAANIPVGFKDLGAGGIACATSEIGAAAGLGVRIDLSSVEVAEEDMLPEVIACSETQERYAFVVPRAFTPEVLRIFNEDFELPELCHGAMAKVIGQVIPEPRFVLTHGGEVVCDASTEAITTGISYAREARERARDLREAVVPADVDIGRAILAVMGSPNLASREHVYRHYDSEVKGGTVARPGEADACVIAPIPGSPVGVAVSADGNPFLGAIDPYQAGAGAVAEAVRNVAAVGAAPIALTDCLNFGNPEVPEVFHDFVEAVKGIGDAARALGLDGRAIPVVSGNVSFYNQSAAGNAVLPSPIVCAVGRLPDHTRTVTQSIKGAGNEVYVLGERHGELGGSAFARVVLGTRGRSVPPVRFDEERRMASAVVDLAAGGLLESCHDVSDGGLAAAAVEMILSAAPDSTLGLRLDLGAIAGGPLDAAQAARIIFCENGGYVIEVDPGAAAKVRGLLEGRGVWFRRVGEVAAAAVIEIEGIEGQRVSLDLASVRRAWSAGAARFMR
jgi:phosphoribosylformylglycinamidine synthase